MRHLRRRSLLVIFVLLISMLCGLPPARACGPFAREAIFSYIKHPDLPLDRYARGELGVLQPTYARSYLYVAYRYASGLSFNQKEQQALVSLWNDRLGSDWENKAEDSKAHWLAARKKVASAGPDPRIEVSRPKGKDEYDVFLNCASDTFETAARTLEERIKQFGADSPETKEWLAAQDKVLANCAGGETIPDAPTSSAPLIRADRAYQIAAANFYAMKFDEARTQFEKIAGDSASPWHETAQYLVARSLIRKASLGDDAHRNENLTQAETELHRTLTGIKQGPLHDSAAKLLNLVNLRLHPAERLHELAQSLMKPGADDDLKQDLWDYTVLFDEFLGDSDEPAGENVKKNPGAVAEDDLSDWLRAFKANDKDALKHSLERWQKTKSQAWLIASLSKASAANAEAASLIEAAGKISPDSPAYATASFHAVRLLIESGDHDAARRRLDAILKQNQPALPPSAVNQFLNQRMMLAANLGEFLKYAQRIPAAFSWGEDGRELPIDQKELSEDDELKQLAGRTLFDANATRVMNEQFPLSLLKEAATSAALPARLRRSIALAAWTRAVLLDDVAVGKAVAPTLAALAPEMKPALDAYLAADMAAPRRAAALYALLKFPGTRPFIDPGIGRLTPLDERDSFHDNWWCERSPDAYSSEGESEKPDDTSSAANASVVEPDFLSAAQKAAGKKERAQLLSLGTGPNYLAREAVEWANRMPNDPRVPEALHLAVVATRYGCSDKDTGPLSKAAWQFLHRRYPNSSWTKKTPYWFNGN